MSKLPDPEDLPEAVADTRPGLHLQLVWIVPIVAALIGGWIAVTAILERGPTVTIEFQTADGLEAGKTRIRYKNVDMGEVKTIAIAPDRQRIIVTAQFFKEAESFLREDTRFWVVRPRFSGGQVSGLNTLLSGAYIAMDVGKASRPKRDFVGLEVAPILTSDAPGRQFMLSAPDLGSLDIGSPVYFRRIKVGEVVAYDLDPNGSDVHVLIFVHAPYDRYVGTLARFWNASGVDIALDANGMRVQTQGLATILAGGVAFESLPDVEAGVEAAPGSEFTLYRDRASAMKSPDGEAVPFVLYFTESLRGLVPGAPVDFRGIVVGEVQAVDVRYEAERKWFHFPVRIVLYPQRIGSGFIRDLPPAVARRERDELLKAMIERGFRAQLRTGNLLTGQLYIALDFFPAAPPTQVDWSRNPLELPTVPGTVEELQQSVAKLLKRVDKFPLEDIGGNARDTLATLNVAAGSLDKLIKRLDSELAPESRATLTDVRKTLATLEKTLAVDAPLQRDVRDMLGEATRAARSLRQLADTLEREPEALLRGKTKE